MGIRNELVTWYSTKRLEHSWIAPVSGYAEASHELGPLLRIRILVHDETARPTTVA
jgi:hypothetical protein